MTLREAVQAARSGATKIGRSAIRAQGLRIERPPSALLRHPEAELRMQLDYALAQRVAIAEDFFFVQIGAFDGRSADPLYGYVRAYEWRGVLVEPQRRYFDELRANYRGHEDRLDFRCVAVDATGGERTLYSVADRPGVPHWAGLLTSFDRNTLLSHGQFLPGLSDLIMADQVPCVALNDLLAEAPTDHIELLQIDVEGFDHVLINALDLARFAPTIVRFEHEHLTRQQHDACLAKFIDHGYKVALEEHDTLAYRPSGPSGGLGSVAVAADGPTRLQAQHDAQVAEQQRVHEAQVQALEEQLSQSISWTEQVSEEAARFREQSLAELRAHLEAQIKRLEARTAAAERDESA